MRAAERAHWPQSGVEERGRGRQRHVGPLRMLALVKLLSNAICVLGVEKVCCQPRAGVIGGRPAIRGVRRGLPNCFTFHRARKQPLRAMRKEGCAQRVYVRSMCGVRVRCAEVRSSSIVCRHSIVRHVRHMDGPSIRLHHGPFDGGGGAHGRSMRDSHNPGRKRPRLVVLPFTALSCLFYAFVRFDRVSAHTLVWTEQGVNKKGREASFLS